MAGNVQGWIKMVTIEILTSLLKIAEQVWHMAGNSVALTRHVQKQMCAIVVLQLAKHIFVAYNLEDLIIPDLGHNYKTQLGSPTS